MRASALEGLLLVAIALFVLLFAGRPIWNIDLFWHMAAGEYIVSTGTLPTHDIFSAIDPERSWVTFQWGYEVLVYLAEQAGGLGAVRLLHTLVIVSAFGLMWWSCRRRLNLGPWVSIALTLLLIVLFGDRLRARPHIFNLLGWVLALPWLIRGPSKLDKGACLGVALTVGCWANLHAGGALIFLIAAATLPAGACALMLVQREDGIRDLKRSSLWFASALIPALASPLFIRGNLQALTTFSDHEGVIGEWQPSWHFLSYVTPDRLGSSGLAHLLCGLAPTLLAFLLITTLWQQRTLSDRAKGIEPWRALFVLAMVVLGHRSVRFVYVVAFGLAALAPFIRWRWPSSRQYALAVVITGLAFASYGFNISAQHASLQSAMTRALDGEHLDTRRYPVSAADFLSASGFEGHIFCQTNWGGYQRWRLGPKTRLIADGRANFSSALADDLAYVYDRSNLGAPDAGPRREAIYGRYDVDIIVHQHPVWPSSYTPDPASYLRIFADARGEVWLRNTPRGAAYLERLRSLGGGPR